MEEQEPPAVPSVEQMDTIVLDEPSSTSNTRSDPLSSAAESSYHHSIGNDDAIVLSSPSFTRSPNSDSSFNSFLEPPSYAESVFTSFDSSNGEFSHACLRSDSSSASSGSVTSEFIRISVSDPRKEQELSNSIVTGGNYYYSYLITTRTNFPEFGGTEFSVRRRFKDVVTLADRLAESYRGFFIPLRPDKSVVEGQMMQKQEFVEQRRIALEKYLKNLASHPVIKKSDELRVFFQTQGKLPLPKTTDVASRMLDGAVKLPKQIFGESVGGAVDISEVSQPAKGGRDLFRIFKELKQSVANDWGGVKPAVVEEDKEFLEKRDKLQDFEHQLADVSQKAEVLVKTQQDIGETMGELGLAFVKLTKFETEEALYESQSIRAGDMKIVATAAVKASRFFRELNSQTVKHLDKLHDYLGMMIAVNNAFSDRSSALLTVQSLMTELSSLNSRIEKLEVASSKIFGGDRTRMRKIDELKETVRLTENAKSCGVREYERIKDNNKNEVERLDKEMNEDFLSMLKGFVVNQAGYAEKMGNVWDKVAEETIMYAKESF